MCRRSVARVATQKLPACCREQTPPRKTRLLSDSRRCTSTPSGCAWLSWVVWAPEEGRRSTHRRPDHVNQQRASRLKQTSVPLNTHLGSAALDQQRALCRARQAQCCSFPEGRARECEAVHETAPKRKQQQRSTPLHTRPLTLCITTLVHLLSLALQRLAHLTRCEAPRPADGGATSASQLLNRQAGRSH